MAAKRSQKNRARKSAILNSSMELEQLPGDNYFLEISQAAAEAIEKIGDTKPQGSFRIKCDPQGKRTEIVFAWDDQYTRDDYSIPVPNCRYDIVMDALSIAYILDEYVLSHDGYRFILNKNPNGPLRHQRNR